MSKYYLPNLLEARDAVSELLEDVQGELLGNLSITGDVGVQEVARVVQGVELSRILGIPDDGVEIDDSVEDTAGLDEVIDIHPRRRTQTRWVGVRLDGVVGRAEGSDGSGEERDAERVYTGGDLLECLDELGFNISLALGSGWGHANVVDTLEDHGILHSGVGKNVTVDTTDRVGTEAVCQDTVAASRLVDHSDIGGR